MKEFPGTSRDAQPNSSPPTGEINMRPGVDADGAIWLHIGSQRPSATQAERWSDAAQRDDKKSRKEL